MKPAFPAAIALVILMMTAGCTSGGPKVEGGGPPAVDPSASTSASADQPVRVIKATAVWSETVTGGGPSCSAANPRVCREHITSTINFTGGLHGQATAVIRGADSPPGHPTWIAFRKNPFVFTGSVPGCGSGSMAFVVDGWFYDKTSGDAGEWTNETIKSVPGSTTTGLAGLVDATFYMDAKLGPNGFENLPIAGTIRCR